MPVSHGVTVWLTGLSGAGKSTLARAIHGQLCERGIEAEVIDGDVFRKNLSSDLGFSKEDRDENVRRLGFISQLLNRHGVTTLVAAISPYRGMRQEMRASFKHFVEVYVNAPLEVCEKRDTKGHYKRARAGELAHFTGVTDPYEAPLQPDVECRTDQESVEECVAKVMAEVERRLDRGCRPKPTLIGTAT